MLVFASTPEENVALAKWAAARVPHLEGGEFPRPYVAGAIVRDDEIAAAVLFYGWQPAYRSLQVSAAAATPLWCRPGVLRAIFHYAFVQCGAYVLHVGTPAANTATVRWLKKIGFVSEGVLRHRYGKGKHSTMLSMTVDEWRQGRFHWEMPK